MRESIVSPIRRADEQEFEAKLRPRKLEEFIGQEKIKEQLYVFIEAARRRGEALDHVLLYGPPGLGKTTLAYIIANEMGVGIRTSSGPVIEQPKDMAAMLTQLKDGEVFFIDEIHRLHPSAEEVLYPAMEDFKLDILIGKGPSARTLRVDLPKFTLVGATTRAGLLTSPLRARFGVVLRIGFYNDDEMYEIIVRSARILGITIDKEGAYEIARRSRGTPRIANRLLRRVRDYAEVRADGCITREVADSALRMLEVDEYGLDNMDKMILKTLVHKFKGGPVGINALAAAIGEEKDTIEEVYEPYLLQEGLIERTPNGRKLTPRGYECLKKEGITPLQEELWGT